MTQYKSFSTSKKKIEKIWNQSEKNTNNIGVIKRLSFKSESVNFLKKITDISIIDNQEYTELDMTDGEINEVIEIDLFDYPEWILNHINVVPIVKTIGDINNDIVYIAPDYGINRKIGHLLCTNYVRYWFAKTDGNNYKLKIYLNLGLSIITYVNLQGQYLSDILPFSLDLSLKIINPRIYENS